MFARGLLAATLAIAGCGHVDYARTKPGTFAGSLFVMWIGEGGSSGDGLFLFVPDPNNPLTFTWTNRQGLTRQVRPEMMYTDGGSIPRIAQVFRGFAPWGYAPAYVIHDWLYVARHCNLDGTPTPTGAALAGIGFAESSEIMAAAMITLRDTGRVKRDDLVMETIADAVAGPIARGHWDRKGACVDEQVKEQDRAAAEAAIPGSSRAAVLQKSGIAPAMIVGAFAFQHQP